MKRTILVVLLIAVFGVFTVSLYAAMDKTAVPKGDMKFAQEAASGNMLEIELGKYVSQNAASDEVKQFAQRVVNDHTKVNDELMTIAKNKGITLPSQMNKKDMKTYQDLQKKKGADLDKAYVKKMIKDHKDDIKLFQKEAKDGKDPDLKAFAAKIIPGLQEHLKLAEDLQKKVK